jgi:hypothetical protein
MSEPKCTCGHAELDHASDETHKDTERCWHGVVTGDGCEQQCKKYEPMEAK